MITNFSRRALFAAAALAALSLQSQPAHASAETEQFVKANAQGVLDSLAQTKSAAERKAQFATLMEKFADMPRVADFVLGRYARTARADPALYKEWIATFKEYALAVYEVQLDQYRGNAIKVGDGRAPASKDYVVNGAKRSLVQSSISQKSGQVLMVDWDLQLYPDGRWRVVDAYLKFTPEAVASLAVQQREDFVSRLGSNGGDVRKLMASVKADTEKLRKAIER